MTTANHITDRVFMDATLGRRTGYPDEVAFVSEDLQEVDEILWRNLHDGIPTVVVTADGLEILFTPRRVGLLSRIFLLGTTRRLAVEVRWRSAHGRPYGVRTRLGRRPLTELQRRPA